MADEIGAHIYSCDATDPDAVSGLFNAFHADIVSLDILAYNLSVVPCGPVTEVDPVWIKNAIIVSAYGAFLAAQHAEIRMLGAGVLERCSSPVHEPPPV